jgi:hypothetical protein
MIASEMKIMIFNVHMKDKEILWDSLREEETKNESPEFHYAVLRERLKKVNNNCETKFMSLEELKASRK